MNEIDQIMIDENKNTEKDILKASEMIKKVKEELSKKVVWQIDLIDSLLIWLFSEGHILVEWVPGLAKTLTVDTLSKTLDLGFSRIQFTPDLLPSDLIWTEIYNIKSWWFEVKKWPIFNNFILADEINRAPSKVQSALLEAMAERHITIWNTSFELEKPFIVLATQNPIEQSWTYKLPEAELDRFMLKVNVSYPSYEEEKEMYKSIIEREKTIIKKVLKKEEIFWIQDLVDRVFMSDSIYEYVTNIIDATRNPEKYDIKDIKKYIMYWASPRAWLSILKAARVNAMFEWRSFVIPEDIKKILNKALSHRIVLSYEAIAEDISEEYIINIISNNIKIV